MPFWLFAILWALVSYIIVTVLLSLRSAVSTTVYTKQNVSKTNVISTIPTISNNDQVVSLTADEIIPVQTPRMKARARGRPTELPDGYYILNSEATEAAGGIPKYIFLGKGLPED
jgi:hypothetical protein